MAAGKKMCYRIQTNVQQFFSTKLFHGTFQRPFILCILHLYQARVFLDAIGDDISLKISNVKLTSMIFAI